MFNSVSVLWLVSLVAISAGAYADEKPGWPPDLQQVPLPDQDFHAKVSFRPGSAQVDPAAKAALSRLVRDAGAFGAVDVIAVAASADAGSSPDVELAGRRADATASFLRFALGQRSVMTFNLASPRDWLAAAVRSLSSGESVSSFAKRNTIAPLTSEEVELTREGAERGNALVIVRDRLRPDEPLDGEPYP